MNAVAEEIDTTPAEAAPKKPAKPKPEVEVVTMDDGRTVEFSGTKTRVLKDYVLREDGSLDFIRLDFRNGVSKKITIPDSLLGRFAGHGAIQKYGDELAGMKNPDGSPADIDDLVLAIEELDEVIQRGEWSIRKEGDGLGGTSVLIRAMVIYSGKTIDQVKAYLKDKDAKFKAVLRANDKRPNKDGLTMAAIVKQLESEKLAKGTQIDAEAALEGLEAFI